jgi:glycosyltransferase involved in cell wall biosynthesis
VDAVREPRRAEESHAKEVRASTWSGTINGESTPARHIMSPVSGEPLRLVCLVTHNNPGGAQQALSRLSDGLCARGHAVQVWSLYGEPRRDGPMVDRIVLARSAPGIAGYVRVVWRLARALRSHRPDAVISFLPLANIAGQFAAWIAGVPNRVASQRNPFWTYHWVMQLADRVAGSIGLYTRNVANSESVSDSFAGYPNAYVRRLAVVYNGLAWGPSPLSRNSARAQFGLPVHFPLIVNIGRLSPQKNQTLLLRAVQKLPQTHLAIAGDGELDEALRREAALLNVAERVHFLGRLEQSSVADLLAAADLFVQPSLFEGQSNALLEAMNAGVPIVASDIPPQAETLRGDNGAPVGRLLPIDDVGAWATEIGSLLGDPEQRERMAARARRRAGDFTIERMAEGFECAVMENRPGRGNTKKAQERAVAAP